MENKEYIMVGAKIISRDLFRNVLRPIDNMTFKPSGGFWSSPYIEGQISSWFRFLRTNPELLRYKNIQRATLFSLRENAKILTVDSKEVLDETVSKYPSYQHMLNFCDGEERSINYELLSSDYDGIFLDDRKLYNSCFSKIFRGWSVESLLLFNLDAIDTYQSVDIDFIFPDDLYHPYLKNMQEVRIEEESFYHKYLYDYAKTIFNELLNKRTNFNDYDDYFSFLIKCIKSCIKIVIHSKNKEVSIIRKNLKEKGIDVTNYIIVRNICVSVLSNYFKNNANVEKELPKTKVKKIKEYPIDDLFY